MPGFGGHRFEFVGREPLVFRVLVILFMASMFLDLALPFLTKHLLPRASVGVQACEALMRDGVQYHAPEIICWYATRSNKINLLLFAVLIGTLFVFRKRVRYVGRK